MFKKSAVRRITWPVTVNIPQDDGKTQGAEFDCEFEILGVKEHDELVGSGADLLSRVLVGWARLMNEAGDAPVDFSEAEKTAMLDITYVRAAITLAYYEAAHGNKAKRKNSH